MNTPLEERNDNLGRTCRKAFSGQRPLWLALVLVLLVPGVGWVKGLGGAEKAIDQHNERIAIVEISKVSTGTHDKDIQNVKEQLRASEENLKEKIDTAKENLKEKIADVEENLEEKIDSTEENLKDQIDIVQTTQNKILDAINALPKD